MNQHAQLRLVMDDPKGRAEQVVQDTRLGFSTHVKGDVQPSAQRLNPLKASKRSQRQGV